MQYGKRRLTVDVDYKRVPLGYKYLEQYHGFKHPLAGTGLHNSYGNGYKNQVSLPSFWICKVRKYSNNRNYSRATASNPATATNPVTGRNLAMDNKGTAATKDMAATKGTAATKDTVAARDTAAAREAIQ